MSEAISVEAGEHDPGLSLGHLKSTVKHGSIYALGMVLAKLVGFLMIPIYTHYLTPADYGILELLSMTVDIIAYLTGLGLTWAVIRYYYYYDDPEDKKAVVSTAAILLVLLFGVSSAVALPFASTIASIIVGDPQYARLVRLALLMLFVFAFLEIPLVFLRAKQDSMRFVALSLVRFTTALALNILFLVVLGYGVSGVLYSTIISSALVGTYLMGSTLRETGIRFSPVIMKQLARYGTPLIAAELGSFVLHYSDRYFLRVFDSLTAVGLYSLAYKLAFLMALFIANPFSQIWIPKVLEIERSEPERARPILRNIISHYNVVLVTAGLAVSLFAREVLMVMASSEFWAAAETVPLLCLGILFFGYRQISHVGPSIRERTDLIAAGVIVATIVVIGLNFLLIPRWGPFGAAVATATAFASEFVVVMLLSARIYPLGYPIARLLRPLLLAIVVYALVELSLPVEASLLTSLALKSLGLMVFGLAVVTWEGMLPSLRTAGSQALSHGRRSLRRGG